MPKKKTTPTKNRVTKAAARTVKPPEYRRLRYQKRIKHPGPRLPSVFSLLRRSFGVLKANWKLIGGILLVYAVLSLVLVRGFGEIAGISELKTSINELTEGSADQVSVGLALFGELLVTTGETVQGSAGVYQLILTIITSLALIWALRQVFSADTRERPGIKAAFYNGQYPLVPFILVLVLLTIQLLPLLVGSQIYGIVVANGLAVTGAEQAVWLGLFIALALWSAYMVSATVLALYIVTLPDMTPMRAWRSARELARLRRWTVLRKVVFLPVALLILGAAILVPTIIFAASLAEWVFFIFGAFCLAMMHTYFYSLYREML